MPPRIRIDGERLALAVAKLISVGPAGWGLLFQARASIIAATALVRDTPQGELIDDLEQRRSNSEARPADLKPIEDVCLALDRAARFGTVRPLCLVRAIALHRLLEKRGIPGSRIHVGVRMNGQAFEAHAWVEWNGRVVGDDLAYVQKFDPLPNLVAQAPTASSIQPISPR